MTATWLTNSSPHYPTPQYVERRIGRAVRIVQRSGRDVIGRLAAFDDGELRVEPAGRPSVAVAFRDVVALYVRG